MAYSGQRFVNISIKFRFHKYQFVHLVGERGVYKGEECEIIGWTATRVKLRIPGTNYWLIRAPTKLRLPYNNTERIIIRFQPY